MSPRLFRLLSLFKSKLSRQIVFWIFASLITIESVILIPSYFKRQEELLSQIDNISQPVINSLIHLDKEKDAARLLLDNFQELKRDTVILGVVIYRDGKLIGTAGELPEISFYKVKSDNSAICYRYFDGNRYDVAWIIHHLGRSYMLIIRHDASSVKQELFAYTGRIAGLVLLISVFVTSVMMLVLNVIVIAPILKLREDLIAAGEALSKNQPNFNFYSLSSKRKDELGEVMEAFNQMFHLVYEEITRRKQTENILRHEQEKSERLLLNILPGPIAEQLKQGKSNIAEEFAEVTILFADLVGFTEFSANVSPEKLVKLLNEIFSQFDLLTERHGLEKIKTIGDAYMVVGGLPMPRSDHATAIAEMAIDIQQEIAKFNIEHDRCINIRIGINTGPVVAGVIGTKKFIYDLWGDAVNTASRMESHGIPGMIQVTEVTFELLQDKYQFEKRGSIPVKGKGEMVTYLLLGRKISSL